MTRKPKLTQPETPYEPQGRDDFQTPNYATDLIVPYLKRCDFKTVWEPCCGRMLKIVTRLAEHGFETIGTDLIYGKEYNALEYTPDDFDCVVTNPPFSIKSRIISRFIALDKPFAFLIPGDWCQWLIDSIRISGCQLVVPTRRINYITPSGKQGKESSAMFHSVWLTRKLNLSETVVFRELLKSDYDNI